MDTINSFEICPKPLIQTYPSLTFDGQNYIAVWSDNNFGGSSYYLAAARITPAGVVLDTGACITGATGYSEYRAKIDYDGDRCLVVWPKTSGPIYGRFINSQCQPEGNIFVIAPAPVGGPNIAFGDTSYLVVWFSGAYPALELHGQIVSTQGTLLGGPIDIVLGSGCHRWADVVFDGTKYLVVWQTGENNLGQKIYGQFIATDGSLLGSNFMICDNTTQERWWPAIAVSDSNFLVAWGQGSGSACDIWGNVDVAITGVSEYSASPVYGAKYFLNVNPNPFTQLTQIRCTIQDAGCTIEHPGLAIYDAAGRKVKSFDHESWIMDRESGVVWDGCDDNGQQLGSGVYFLELQAGTCSHSVKILLIR